MVSVSGGLVAFGRGLFVFFAFRGDGSVVAMGCGAMWLGPGKVSSYHASTAVTYGVLAVIRVLFAEHRAAGVELYLDNTAVVDIFDAPAR